MAKNPLKYFFKKVPHEEKTVNNLLEIILAILITAFIVYAAHNQW